MTNSSQNQGKSYLKYRVSILRLFQNQGGQMKLLVKLWKALKKDADKMRRSAGSVR